MDLAKAIAVLAANKGKAEDYLGLNKVPGPGPPKIMVPTTAGTGSEVTFTAVFIRKKLKKKEGMNSSYLYPELALLDPELTLTLPPHPTAATGIDALCHAIESYTSINASPMSEVMSLEAIRPHLRQPADGRPRREATSRRGRRCCWGASTRGSGSPTRA